MSTEAEYYTPEELAIKCAVPLERVKNEATADEAVNSLLKIKGKKQSKKAG